MCAPILIRPGPPQEWRDRKRQRRTERVKYKSPLEEQWMKEPSQQRLPSSTQRLSDKAAEKEDEAQFKKHSGKQQLVIKIFGNVNDEQDWKM